MTRAEVNNLKVFLRTYRTSSQARRPGIWTLRSSGAGEELSLFDPAFRWNFVNWFYERDLPLPPCVSDNAMLRADRFLRGRAQPDLNLALAYGLTLPGSKPQRDLLYALLVCKGATIQSVAKLCRLDPQVVDLFEALFWNCLDRWKERPYLARICGQADPDGALSDPQKQADLGSELLRIAYRTGRSELVLVGAGLQAPASRLPAPVLLERIRREYLACAVEGIDARAFSEIDNPALPIALRMLSKDTNEPVAERPPPSFTPAEAVQYVQNQVNKHGPWAVTPFSYEI